MKTIRNSSYVKNQYWKLSKRTNKQTKKNYVDIGWLWRLGKREAVFGKEYEERERERERKLKKVKNQEN